MLLRLSILVALLGGAYVYGLGCLEFGKEEGKRDAALFGANPTKDDYKNKFHRQRLTWRGAVLVLGAVAATAVLLLCPWSGWVPTLSASLTLWGAAVWNDSFTPTLNRERKLAYVDDYYVSPNADASFWDRHITALAAYFLIHPSATLQLLLTWSIRISGGLWVILFLIFSYTLLSR